MKLKKLLLTWSVSLLCFLTFFSLKAQSISGAIHTADGAAMEGITIKVNDESAITNLDGTYMFLNLVSASNYTIVPTKAEINPMNGVNTFDLVVMIRHILGLVPFHSPYQKIAADVNNSGTITTMDVVKLRRLILNMDEDFGDMNPWRFVDANFEMDNGNLAQVPDFPEERYLDALVAGLSSIDFKGIKIGDVNFTASSNFSDEVEERNEETLQIEIEQTIENDYTILSFQSKDFQNMAAFQFTLDFSAHDMDFVQAQAVELANFNAENLGLKFEEQGKLTISWQDIAAVTLEDNSTLFQLKFKNKNTNNAKEAIYISSAITPALAFRTDGEELQVAGQYLNNITPIDDIELENFPNPFHDQTTVRFSLIENGEASLRVLTSTGKVLKTIEGTFEKGINEVILNRQNFNMNKGLFFLQLQIKNKTIIRKIMFN